MFNFIPNMAGFSKHRDLVNCGKLYLATFDNAFTK